MSEDASRLDRCEPDLSIIIVSWNVRDLLRACLRSLIETLLNPRCPTLEIIVVDNASADGSAEMVAAEFPSVRLIANPENYGFTRGNNQGLALARGRYVLFLNPDTVVIGDAFETMVAYMDTHVSVGALGPRLLYGDRTLQSSRRRFPTFWMALFESTPLAWHWPASHNYWARCYRMEDHRPGDISKTPKDSGEAEEVDWLVGAALLVRREALDQVGGFDEGYFMYSEELDWCRRARAAGWRIVYLSAAEIMHYEGKSSGQVPAARHILFQTSKVRYFRKYHGPVAALFLRFAILGMFALEWLFEAAKWLLGSKRSLRKQRMTAYRRLLQSGLRLESRHGELPVDLKVFREK